MNKKTHRPPQSKASSTKAKSGSGKSVRNPKAKKQIAIALLERPKGASIAELTNTLDWQEHSVRGFLSSTVKKLPGIVLVSEKPDNEPRRYQIRKLAG